MKVKAIWDYSVTELEDFSKDKVQIEMSFDEFNEIRRFLDDVWIKAPKTELGKKAWLLGEELKDYDSECIG